MKDTVNPKSKPHRGYAFVVYEREKDMKGIAITMLCVFSLESHLDLSYGLMFSLLTAISFIHFQPPTRKQMAFESRTDVFW